MSWIHERIPRLDSRQDGPALSKRSEPVELAAETRLRGSSYPQLYRIRCDFQAGVLTLRGRVTSYYLKQIAQNLVDRLENGVEVDNQLDVVTPSIPRQRKPW